MPTVRAKPAPSNDSDRIPLRLLVVLTISGCAAVIAWRLPGLAAPATVFIAAYLGLNASIAKR